MKTFELSVSPNYVSNWTEFDAIRELLQNAIDEGNMDVEYGQNQLVIKSFGSKLDLSTLVLGNTTKANDKTKIGQYGEGYKLAMLVLLRNGHYVNVTNYDEDWQPFFDNSEQFNTPVLKIKVSASEENSGFVAFSIGNISQFVYDDLVKRFPCVENNYGDTLATEYGDILFDKKFSGKIFVGGLFVQTDSSFKYGYNFNPESVSLDRDRKAINYWDLRKLTAQAIITAESCNPKIFKAISDTCTDAKDIIEVLEDASENFLKEFKEMYYEENQLNENTIVATKGIDKELKSLGDEVRSSVLHMEDVNVHVGSEIESFIIAKAQKYDWWTRVSESAEKRNDKKDAQYYFNNSDYKKLLVWYKSIENQLTEPYQKVFMDLVKSSSELQPSYFSKIKSEVFANLDKALEEPEEEDED